MAVSILLLLLFEDEEVEVVEEEEGREDVTAEVEEAVRRCGVTTTVVKEDMKG
jgi:hypothetical protein